MKIRKKDILILRYELVLLYKTGIVSFNPNRNSFNPNRKSMIIGIDVFRKDEYIINIV